MPVSNASVKRLVDASIRILQHVDKNIDIEEVKAAIAAVKNEMENVYIVDCVIQVPVVARDRFSAESIARDNLEEELVNAGVSEYRTTNVLDHPDRSAWSSTIPYGDTEEREIHIIVGEDL